MDGARSENFFAVQARPGATANGRGSVEFGLSSPMTGWYENSGMELFARGQMASSGVSFYDIEDPRGVADLVERLRDEDRAR